MTDFLARASQVDLTGLGDPLLSPVFWEIIDKYPANRGGQASHDFLTFTTNGTLLTEANIGRLLKSRIKTIFVSVDAADPDQFKAVRGTELAPIIEGIRRLLVIRDRAKLQQIRVGLHMTWMRKTLHGVPAMIDLASELGVDFLQVFPVHERSDAVANTWIVEKNPAENFHYKDSMLSGAPREQVTKLVDQFHDYARVKGVPIASFIFACARVSDDYPLEEWALLFGQGEAKPQKSWRHHDSKVWAQNIAWKKGSIRCPMPWKELFIHYDGEVNPCCWFPKPLASLQQEPIEKIWNGEAMQKIRSDLIDGKVPKLCEGAGCPFLNSERTSSALEAAPAAE